MKLPRDASGPVVPKGLPVSATMLARTFDGADVPAPNVLSAQHLGQIGGGMRVATNLQGAVGHPTRADLRHRRRGLCPMPRKARRPRHRHPPAPFVAAPTSRNKNISSRGRRAPAIRVFRRYFYDLRETARPIGSRLQASAATTLPLLTPLS